jgi:hypothetical protein
MVNLQACGSFSRLYQDANNGHVRGEHNEVKYQSAMYHPGGCYLSHFHVYVYTLMIVQTHTRALSLTKPK